MSTSVQQTSARKRTVPLQAALLLPFLITIFCAVGITGALSIRNGRKTVDDMAIRLEESSKQRIQQHLNSYLPLLPKLTEINLNSVEKGNLNLQNLTQMGQVFCTQMRNFEIGYFSFGDPQGNFIGVERLDNGQLLINEQSARTKGKLAVYPATDTCDRGVLSEMKEGYSFKKEDWYFETLKARKPIWSSIYNWDDKPEVMSVSFNAPVYNRQNEFQGVIGGDFILSQLSAFVQNLQVTPSTRVFLIERNGDLIASSVDKRPYKLVNQKAQRLTAEESADAVIRDTSKYLKSKFDGLGSISNNVSLQTIIQGETHYLHVSPWKDWQGLDWLIVIATPERDFLGAFQANTHQTIFLCLVALIVATMIGLWTSRWILVPILGLRDASNALSHDRDDVVAPESNITELNFVSQSFNDMAQRLRSLLEQLKSDNQNLGVQVEEKNQALTEALKLVRYKRDNSAQKQRQVQAYLTILSRQITQPVNLMQDELGNAKENLQAMLDELSNYREQIKQFPPELRQELSSADLDLLIADLQKRVFLIEQGHLHIDDLSQKLNQYIQQIQHIEKS